jgi:hypothetical protein
MTGILRPFGVANKADEEVALDPRLSRLLFRHQGTPSLSVTSSLIPALFTLALAARAVAR